MATVNNNWPTPVQTDLVKDGWEAIKDLGDAIDTTLGVYADPGLVLLNTTSFSGVASQSINDVFSATYDNYRIIINQVGTLAGQLRFRYRVSGADNSATNYRQQVVGGDGAAAFAGRDTGLTFHLPGRTANGVQNSSIVDIINPFSSTLRTQQFTNYNDLTTGNITIGIITSQLDVTTSYTGFSLLPENGTITGKVFVYGYNL